MSKTAEAIGYLEQARSAEVAEGINANMELARGKQESARIRRVGARQQGKIQANVGKAGVTMSGSAKLAIEEAIRVNREDALQAEFTAERSALNRRMTAAARVSSAKSKLLFAPGKDAADLATMGVMYSGGAK